MANEKVQRTVFDLDSFEEVLLVKEFDYAPVTSIEEAMAKLGNNAAKLLEVINDGLRGEVRNQVADDPTGWHTFDDEGEMNGDFTGTIADQKAVNTLVLTLAKTVFGFSKDLDKDAKKASKSAAMEMIKTNPAIKDGLKRSAAKKASA